LKLIIAGSRNLSIPFQEFDRLIDQTVLTKVVCGMAKGVDSSGWSWAVSRGHPIKEFPANWDEYGPAAGPLRNSEMAAYADTALLFWSGDKKSRGTVDMASQMSRAGKPYLMVLASGPQDKWTMSYFTPNGKEEKVQP
jgi:hypothetical protein